MGEIVDAVSRIYERGIIAEAGNDSHVGDLVFDSSVIFVQKDRRATKVPSSEVYDNAGADEALLSILESALPDTVNADSLCRAAGIYDLLKPNLLFDRQTTELVHDEAVNYISPTSGVISAGQLIVSQGEIVTAEIEQLLDSYKAEYENSLGYNGPRVLLWIGNIMLALTMVVILYFAIYYANYRIFGDINKYVYLLVVFLIAAPLRCS